MKNLEVEFILGKDKPTLTFKIINQHEKLRNNVDLERSVGDVTYYLLSVARPWLCRNCLFIRGFYHKYDEARTKVVKYQSFEKRKKALSAFRHMIRTVNRRKLN